MKINREWAFVTFLLLFCIVAGKAWLLSPQNLSLDQASFFSSFRFYDPKIGKFIQADHVVPAPGNLGLNRFAYAYNNPVRYIDPDGHVPLSSQDPDEESLLEKLALDALDIVEDTLKFGFENSVLYEMSRARDAISDPESSEASKFKALLPAALGTIAAGGASGSLKPKPKGTKGVGFIDLSNRPSKKHNDWGDEAAGATDGRGRLNRETFPVDNSAGRLNFTSSPELIKQQAADLRNDLADFAHKKFTPGQTRFKGPQYLVSARASYLAQRAWLQRNRMPHRPEFEVITNRFSKETAKEGISFRDVFFKQHFYDADGRHLGERSFKVTEAWNRLNVYRFRVRVEKEVVRRNRRTRQKGQTPPHADSPRRDTFGKGWKYRRMPGSGE